MFDSSDIDPEERDMLRQAREKRNREEFLRMKKLQEDNRLRLLREDEARMREMNIIQERERQELELKERLFAVIMLFLLRN